MRSSLFAIPTSLRISPATLPTLSVSDKAMPWMRATECDIAGKSLLLRMRRSRNAGVALLGAAARFGLSEKDVGSAMAGGTGNKGSGMRRAARVGQRHGPQPRRCGAAGPRAGLPSGSNWVTCTLRPVCRSAGTDSNNKTRDMFQAQLMAGQRVLVTGGGTGLGKSMAERFLGLGADIAICGRRKSVCDETAEGWRTRFPDRRIDTFGLDIRIAQAVHEMVEALWAGGGLTGLVNNAAGNFIAPTESLSPRAFDAIANIVFHGTFYVTQAVGQRWIAQARAGQWQPGQAYRSVMSIITTWVDNGSPYVLPSAMSKAGIDVMTKSLAVEWARYGIRLNAVGPGEIPTEGMSKRLSPGEQPGERSRRNNPMGREGRLAELQNLAAFLMASGQCDWLTGQSIMMDGGNALATGGNFYELRHWSDSDWTVARERIESQNQKDKAQR